MNRKHPLKELIGAKGFTLLEVLLASVILAGLFVLMLGMTDGTSRIWEHGERRRESQREAASSLRIMTGDLRSAVITGDPASLLIHHGTEAGEGGDSVFFLVAHPGDRRHSGIRGDLCAAGYFIAPAPGGHGERNLYCFHASGDEVARAVRSQTLPELYAKAAAGKSTSELLARNVADLAIQTLPGTDTAPRPKALRLTITTMDAATARLIASENPGRDGLLDILKKRGTRLSSLVRLPLERKAVTTP